MSARSRIRCPVVSALLVVSTVLAAVACVTVEIESPEGRDLVDRLPAAAVAVFGGDGDVPDYLEDAMPAASGIEPPPGSLGAVLEEAGVEHDDLDAFAGVVLAPGLQDEVSSIQTATLLRGSFDRERLERALSEHPSTPHEGTTVYRLDMAEQVLPPEVELPFTGLFEMSLAVLDDEILVMGTGAGVRAVLEVEAGAASLGDNEELMALVEEASEGEPTHWGAFSMRQLVDDLVEEPERRPFPEGARSRMFRSLVMSAWLDDDGVRGRLAFEARDETAARVQEEALRGALATLKLGLRSSRPALYEIVDRGVQTELEGPTLRVEFDLNAEDVVTLQRATTERARELLEGARGEDEVGAGQR